MLDPVARRDRHEKQVGSDSRPDLNYLAVPSAEAARLKVRIERFGRNDATQMFRLPHTLKCSVWWCAVDGMIPESNELSRSVSPSAATQNAPGIEKRRDKLVPECRCR